MSRGPSLEAEREGPPAGSGFLWLNRLNYSAGLSGGFAGLPGTGRQEQHWGM